MRGGAGDDESGRTGNNAGVGELAFDGGGASGDFG